MTCPQDYTVDRGQADPPRLHGPYAEWTRKIGGKTITRRLTPAELAEYQPLFDNAKKLRALQPVPAPALAADRALAAPPADAVDVQETEQGPQRGHDPLGRPRLLPGLVQHECPYLAGGQLLQVQAPAAFKRPPLQERADQADAQRDRPRCQAPLGRQVGSEPLQQPPGLRRRLRRRERGRPEPTQVAQQRPEGLDGPLVRVSRQTAGREVPFRGRHVQLPCAQAPGRHPPAQVSGQPDPAGRGERGIAEPEQLVPEPRRVLRE